MTDRYVNPAVGSSGTGDSWAQAYKTLKEATDAAAAGEKIYFATGTSAPPTSDTTRPRPEIDDDETIAMVALWWLQ